MPEALPRAIEQLREKVMAADADVAAGDAIDMEAGLVSVLG